VSLIHPPPKRVKTKSSLDLRSVAKSVTLFIVTYVWSWVIVMSGIFVMNIPQIQAGRTDFVSVETVYQSVGIAIVLYGFQFMLRRILSIAQTKSAERNDGKVMNELQALRETTSQIAANLESLQQR